MHPVQMVCSKRRLLRATIANQRDLSCGFFIFAGQCSARIGLGSGIGGFKSGHPDQRQSPLTDCEKRRLSGFSYSGVDLDRGTDACSTGWPGANQEHRAPVFDSSPGWGHVDLRSRTGMAERGWTARQRTPTTSHHEAFEADCAVVMTVGAGRATPRSVDLVDIIG